MQNNQKENLLLIKDLGMLYTSETKKYKARFGLYKCFCGKEFKAQVHNAKRGNNKSCGCLKGVNHNLANHRMYPIWNAIIYRCNNPKSKAYKDYGARGITVCERWLKVENFIEDMYLSYKDNLSIDRIDNNLGYSKDNCRWTTKNMQSRNKRKLQINNTSGYRGVSWNKASNKWKAQVYINGKKIHIGTFETALDGALAYDKYVIENNLEHTRNFV